MVALVLSLHAKAVFASEDDSSETISAANTSGTAYPETPTNKNQQRTTPAVESQGNNILPEVGVSASRIKQDAVTIDRTQTITTIEAKELERTQPATIFDAVRDVPGVGIEGGPRPSGMTFSVRGFNDSEDVQVRVDGVPKGFEKYRFGGTFVEPELMKSIEVQRGPQISSGSGSIGGTILVRTKDAADLLKPGQHFGGRLKLGYGNNNDELQKSYLVYARPHDAIDILYNRSYRNSNDITHTDGSKLDASNVDSKSQLLKISIFPTENLELATSVVLLEESGLQQYDATGSSQNMFGNVIRTIEDLSISETIRWNPNHPWINIEATIGRGHTDLEDESRPGMKRNSSCIASGAIKPCRSDYHKQKVKSTTIDITNTANLYSQGELNFSLLTGLQHRAIETDIRRTTDSKGNSIFDLAFPADGFWAEGISGKKAYSAFYTQPRLQINRLGIIPGFRIDWYDVSSIEQRVKNHLAEKGLPDEISFTHKTYSLGLTFDLIPKQLTLFGNYAQGFRPPSFNQYFSYHNEASDGFFDRYGFAANQYQGIGKCNTPDTNYLCGNVYKLQTSLSREIGLSYQNPRLLDSEVQLTSKFTYFTIETEHLLTSFEMDPVTEHISQDGVERRKGNEIEASLLYRDSFARVSFSNTWGTDSTSASGKLYRVPAKTLNLTVGTQLLKNLGINASYRKVSARMACLSEPCITTEAHDGYEVFNAGLYWIATSNLTFRLLGENIKNKDYNLNGGQDFSSFKGNRAAGRNIRLIAEISF
ncbi:TonB-dependent receptor [Methylobacillus gramineus]|uniref:TonB-dependent receptor domain-containing protein n=1 Tax=Methylobacillus gramineus TaxID=755169 RepID=UPI001CFFD82F|nr:TonB-dependent receptor [Methylobacillus gramineus]MCB5184169.1 TonB-dependent receptor [Methylobacillus gramineus]